MMLRQLGEVIWLRCFDAFQRRQRPLQRGDQRLSLIEVVILQFRALLGGVKRRGPVIPKLPELCTKTIEVTHEAAGSCQWPGAAQQRQFQHSAGPLERAMRTAEQ